MAYSYCIAYPIYIAGTVAINGTTAVVGSSSHFDTELKAGDYLTVGSQTRIVNVVTDATHLTVTAAYTATLSGQLATRVRMMNVETDLGLPAPRGIYTPYSQPVTLGDGSVRGAGWKTAEWRWGFLTRAQRDILRVYCPGASASVYLRTRTTDSADAYALYTAKMIWPQQEEPEAGRRLDFTVKFQGLVAYP